MGGGKIQGKETLQSLDPGRIDARKKRNTKHHLGKFDAKLRLRKGLAKKGRRTQASILPRYVSRQKKTAEKNLQQKTGKILKNSRRVLSAGANRTRHGPRKKPKSSPPTTRQQKKKKWAIRGWGKGVRRGKKCNERRTKLATEETAHLVNLQKKGWVGKHKAGIKPDKTEGETLGGAEKNHCLTVRSTLGSLLKEEKGVKNKGKEARKSRDAP